MTDGSPPPPVAAAPTPAARHGARFVWTGLSQPFGVGFTATLGALAALVLGFALSSLSTVLIYIFFALFAALGLDPVVRLLERRGMARTWAIVTVFAGFAVVLVGAVLLVVPTVVRQVAGFIDDLPQTISSFMRTDLFLGLESTFGDSVGTILDDVQAFLTDPANIAAIGGGVLQVGVGIATGISSVVIVIVLTLYFIATLPSMKQSLYRLSPARSRARLADMTEQITDSIGGYLMGMVLLAFFNALFTLVLQLILGLPFPALMAVTAFLITIIPLVGPVLFWIIGSTFALFVDPLSALIFAVAYLGYMQIEAYVFTPRVMNRAVSVPGSLVVIGALVGGTLLGLLGALVAIPVTASILLIIRQVVIPRQDAKV